MALKGKEKATASESAASLGRNSGIAGARKILLHKYNMFVSVYDSISYGPQGDSISSYIPNPY